MTRQVNFLRGAATLTLILGLSATAAKTASLINAAGATFPYPMYSKWFDSYHKMHPDVQINYQSIGSGGGIRQVIEGTVDFGATDGPMNDEQLKQFQDNRHTTVFHFPALQGP